MEVRRRHTFDMGKIERMQGEWKLPRGEKILKLLSKSGYCGVVRLRKKERLFFW
jgi:hypothetical protein